MPLIDVAGEPLYYAVHPSREPDTVPVVLLHGAGASHLSWPAALRRWPCATTFVPDLPGHGRSGGPGRDTIEGYADVVRAWQRAAGLSPAVWIGHSLGGAVVLALALRYPEVCRKLVLIGTAPRFTLPPGFLSDLTEDPARAAETLSALTFGPETPAVWIEATRHMMSELPPEVLRRDFQAVAAFDVRARLADVRTPALVVTADDDRLTPPADARLLAAGLPDARLLILPSGGHLSLVMAPTLLHEAIADFVAPSGC